MTAPCPHCGHDQRYGSGDTATCARCHRFVAPELAAPADPQAADTQLDRILRSIAQPGDVWVIRR